MNIYNYIINLMKYKLENEIIFIEYSKIKKEVDELKYSSEYEVFFRLIEKYTGHYFFAPNVAFQIIENVIKEKKYNNVYLENQCELIVNNKKIKKFVDISTKINTIINEELQKIYSLDTKYNNSEENYLYNKLFNELCYLGIGKIINNIIVNNQLILKYEKEREKYIKSSFFIFPFEILRNGFYDKQVSKNQIALKLYENFLLFITIFQYVSYAYLNGRIYIIKKDDIRVVKSVKKDSVHLFDFKVNTIIPLFEAPLIYEVNNELYFHHSLEMELCNKNFNTQCNTFGIYFKNKDSLNDFSIKSLEMLLKE